MWHPCALTVVVAALCAAPTFAHAAAPGPGPNPGAAAADAPRKHPPTAPHATGTMTWVAPSARFSIDLPPHSLDVESESFADAGAEQLDETAAWLDSGRVVISVDAFTNASGQDAAAWLRGAQRGLRSEGVRVETLHGLPRGATAVRLHTPRTSQSYARTIVLLATPKLRLRLTCADATDSAGRALLDAAVAGLRLQRKSGTNR